MKCELVPPENWHIGYIARRVRACDAAEIWASHRVLAFEGLATGVATSVLCFTALFDGEPVAMFGVSPASMLTGEGTPWMLATDKLHQAEHLFLRLCRPVVEAMQSTFPLLVNWVDNRNVRTIRWLEWLGFHVEPPVLCGPDALPFCRFSRSAPCATP